jgi:glycosyltransferase involved in cell wall biosynthesis
MLRVTAIVPTCDRPVLLERALRSIAAQELVPMEVIVVDDLGGAHENVTRRAVERCGLGRVCVVANSRAKGASGARNTGAELAVGELLAFLDDDDEWLPAYLFEALGRFDLRDLDMICADLLCQFDDGVDRPSKSAPNSLAPELFLTRNPGLIGSNFIIRRSLYREIGGFDESLPTCNDRDFGIRLGVRGGVRYEGLPKRLVRHYQHRNTRLCTPKSDAMRAGIRRFYEIHSHRMTKAQREAFRGNVRFFWGINERGEIADGHPARFLEPLLPVLKARLDAKRRETL